MAWLGGLFGGVREIVEGAISALQMAITIIKEIAVALGIIEADKDVEEVGDRAIQAEEAGIRPENFDTYDEYMKAIENFELNPERSKEIKEQDKTEKGLKVLLDGIGERLGVPADGILKEILQAPDFYTTHRVKTYLDVFAHHGVALTKLNDYMDGYLKRGESREVHEIIFEAEKKLQPEKSESELDQLIEDKRRM